MNIYIMQVNVLDVVRGTHYALLVQAEDEGTARKKAMAWIKEKHPHVDDEFIGPLLSAPIPEKFGVLLA